MKTPRSITPIGFLSLVVLTVGLAAAYYLTQQPQDIRQKAAVTAKLNKGINIVLETARPDASVPPTINSKEVGYLNDLGVDEVVVATAWSRIACKDPHISTQDHLPTSISVSSQHDTNTGDEGFSKQNLIDNRPWSRWASKNYGNADPGEVIEWISFEYANPITVNQVVLIPAVWNAHREYGVNAFPQSFNISYSDDGSNWQVIKTINSYPNPVVNSYDNTPPTITIDIPEQTHQYWGFGVTKLRPDYYGSYFVQLGDLKFRKVITTNANPEDQYNPNYNWQYLDQSIDNLLNGGVSNIALVVTGTPRWAIMNHEDSCWEAPYFSEFLWYHPYPPNKYDKLSEYSHFAATVAKRYGTKINRLSFYNEPNHQYFWKGTAQEHVSLHNAAYDKVKQVAPSLSIGGGLTAPHGPTDSWHPLNWLSTVASLNYKFDIYEHHFYPLDDSNPPWSQTLPTDGRVYIGNPDDLFNKLKTLYPNKTIPVVNNEAGYQVDNVGLANKAKYLKWTLENYKFFATDTKTPFLSWSNFMLYIHPAWRTGLIDIGCQLGYPQAITTSDKDKVIRGEIDKVIKNSQGDCLTPAYYAFRDANVATTLTPTPPSPTDSPPPPSPTPNPNDLDGDSDVDIFDYLILISHFPSNTIFHFNQIVQNL